MSDDDSDDSILAQAVFRKRRTSSRKKATEDAGAFLEALVKNRQADTITSMHVARLEKETTATSEPERPMKRERVSPTTDSTTANAFGTDGTFPKASPSLWEPRPALFLAVLKLPSTLKLARQQLKAKTGAAAAASEKRWLPDDHDWDLLSPNVRRQLAQLQQPSLPTDLADYCLQLACCTDSVMQRMAIGAADLLQESSFTMPVSTMKVQLEQCWGLTIAAPVTTTMPMRPEIGTCYNSQNAAVAMTRWLHLWDVVFRRKFISITDTNGDKNTLLATIMDCILLLIHAACDPLLDEASHASALQRIFTYLLGMAESTVENTTQVVKQLMGRLGDKWLDLGIGVMHMATPVNGLSGQPSQQLRLEICQALLESSLHGSSFDLSIVLDRWKWVDQATDGSAAKMLALSYVALQQLRPMVIKGEPHGPLALAVMELALCLLQMSLSSTRRSYPLRQPFQEYCQLLQDLADKSNAWVLNDSNFLRFHYYLLCFKQVPRLEVPIQNSLQPSVHTFFSSQAH